jgi:hypothetical protein
MRLEKASTTISTNRSCQGRKDLTGITSNLRRRVPVNHGANARGNRRENQVKSSKIYKYRIFGIVEQNRTDVGNPGPGRMLPSHLTSLNAAFRKTCYRFEYVARLSIPFGSPRFSPIRSPVNMQILASQIHLKHTGFLLGR